MISPTTYKILLLLFLTMLCGLSPSARADIWDDGKAYVQAPTQWDSRQWLGLGGVLGLTALAYQRDGAVYNYMQTQHGPLGDSLQAIGNSWGVITGLGGLTMLGFYSLGTIYDKPQWQRLGYQGFEAVAFSGMTTAILKVSFGRLRPYQSPGVPDQWFSGGQSFPSGHTTAAFALSTVLAEGVAHPSWQRRALFYSLATMTAYARMYGNNHWLSDTVMGAAIGISTGLFVVHHTPAAQPQRLVVYPTGNGLGFIYLI